MKNDVRSAVPVQQKTVDSTPDEQGIPPKTFPRTICVYACLSSNLFLKKLQATDCKLAMLAQ